MHRRTFLGAVACAAALVPPRASATPAVLPGLPDDAQFWLNGPPRTAAALAGQPVLVEVWTFGCVNCRNSLPWVKRIHARYAPRGLNLIAVHTPEFAVERDPDAVRTALGRLDIGYPVLLDPESRVWRALDNHYWPAFYLYDRQHRLVGTRIGELHAGESSADAFEAAIVAQL